MKSVYTVCFVGYSDTHTAVLRELADINSSSSGGTCHDGYAPDHTQPSFTLEAEFNSALCVSSNPNSH